jgi:membrane associated rhomboid family serine protease
MSRPSLTSYSYSFGPGPISRAVKWLIWANVVVFVLQWVFPALTRDLGLQPADVIGRFSLWQPVTYMFLHVDVMHILFNMLVLWMMGVELERLWGTKFFVRFYFVTGIGAAIVTVLFAQLPFAFAASLQNANVIGASGAIYGLLVAYAYYYPDRPILMFFLFPIPAKYFVMILAAITFLLSTAGGGRVAQVTHLGGLAIGYLYLKAGGRSYLGKGRGGLMAELKYRWVKWKMNRLRRKFDVYSGGRGPWDRTIH